MAYELRSEKVKTKSSSQTQTLILTHGHILKVLCIIMCWLWISARTNEQWADNHPYHPHSWSHATLCPTLQHLSSQETQRSQGRFISHKMLQDSVSYWCYRSCPVILDQHYTSLDVFYFPVRKNMQKIPYQTAGRSAWEINFHIVYVGRKFLTSKQSIEE